MFACSKQEVHKYCFRCTILYCAISANTPNTLDEKPQSICQTLVFKRTIKERNVGSWWMITIARTKPRALIKSSMIIYASQYDILFQRGNCCCFSVEIKRYCFHCSSAALIWLNGISDQWSGACNIYIKSVWYYHAQTFSFS